MAYRSMGERTLLWKMIFSGSLTCVSARVAMFWVFCFCFVILLFSNCEAGGVGSLIINRVPVAGNDLLQSEEPSLTNAIIEQYGRTFENAPAMASYTTHESANWMSSLRIKIRKQLEAFRLQVEAAHDLNVDEAHELEPREPDSKINAESHKRQKRETIAADFQNPVRQKRNYISGDPYKVVNVTKSPHAVFDVKQMMDINVVDMENDGCYIFAVEKTGNGMIKTVIYKTVQDFSAVPEPVVDINTPGAFSVEVTRIGYEWYFLPVVGHGSSYDHDLLDLGSHLYKFDPLTHKEYKQQTIRTKFAKIAVFWKGSGDEANTIYMATAPPYRELGHHVYGYNVNISLYRWQGGYLDYSYSLPAYSPMSIIHFDIYATGYMAVANFRDDSRSTVVYSEIFKYNHKESQYVPFQKILTHGARDIKYFSFRSGMKVEHFLAIANFCKQDGYKPCNYNVRSVIYKYSADRFIPFQTLPTHGAMQFLPIGTQDKFILCLLELGGIKFFQYNGWSFVNTFQSNFTTELDPKYSNVLLRAFVNGNTPYFTIASPESEIESGVYSFEFKQTNSYLDQTDDYEGWCNAAKHDLEKWNASLLVEHLQNAPKVTDPEIHLAGPLLFENKLTITELHSKTLSYKDDTYDAHLYNDLFNKYRTLNRLEDQIREVNKTLENVVYRNENQTLVGPVRFQHLEYNNPTFTSVKAEIDSLNNFNMREMLPNLVHLNRKESLDNLSAQYVETKNGFKIHTLNGHPFSQYATTSSEQEQKFVSQNTFLGSVKADHGFQILGKLNGIFFKDEHFLTNENQTFLRDLILKDSSAKHLHTHTLNGFEVDYTYKEAILNVGDSIIKGHKELNNVNFTNLFVKALLSEVDINVLLRKAIRTKGKSIQHFTNPNIEFEHLKVTLEMTSLDHLVENKDLKDFIKTYKSEAYYEIDNLTLLQPGEISNLQVNHNLNGYRVVNGALDVVLKDSATVQHISNKELDTIYFEKNVETKGTVNGVYLPTWTPVYRILLPRNYLNSSLIVKGFVKAPEVNVDGSLVLNEHDLLYSLQHCARLDSETLPGNCHLEFDSVRVEGNSVVENKLNGFHPQQWVRKYSNSTTLQQITAPKRFLHGLHLSESTKVASLFDTTVPGPHQENLLVTLLDLMTYKGNQTLRAPVIFANTLTVDHLSGSFLTVDGVRFQDMMLTNMDQKVTVPSIFLNPVFVKQSFAVQNLQVGFLNSIPFQRAVENTLLKHSTNTQEIRGWYTFENGLTVTKNLKTGGRIGQYDFLEILHGLVQHDANTPLVVNGTMRFSKSARIENLNYKGTMNGIRDEAWGNEWLLNNGQTQTVQTPVKFANLKTNEIHVLNNKVSNIDINYLNHSAVRINEAGRLSNVTFRDVMHCPNGIILGSDDVLVNNYNLRKDLLLMHHPGKQVVTGEKVFLNGFTVDGDIFADKFHCLEHIGRFVHGNEDDHKEHVLVIKGNLLLQKEPEIRKTINEINWKNFTRNVWWLDRKTEVGRAVDFDSVIWRKGISIQNGPVVSGINLTELQKFYAGKSKDNIWTGELIFKNEVNVRNETICEDLRFTKGNRLNGVDILEFMNPRNVLINGLDQNIDKPMQFLTLTADSIKLKDGTKMNGLDVRTAFMTYGGKNNFTASKRFGNLVAANKMTFAPGTTIAGVDFDHWNKFAVLKHTNYDFRNSNIHFQKVYGRNISVQGKVNGIDYSAENLFLKNRENQNVTGQWTIDGRYNPNQVIVNITNIYIQNVNHYNFDATVKDLVMKNSSDRSPLYIDGMKTFSKPVYVTQMNMSADKLFQGQNLTKIYQEISTYAHVPPILNVSLNEKYTQMSNRVEELRQNVFGLPVFMGHYEKIASIQLDLILQRVVHVRSYPILLLGMERSVSISETSQWAYSLKNNTYLRNTIRGYQIHIQGQLKDFVELRMSGYAAIVTTNRVQNTPVEIDLPIRPTSKNYEIYKQPGKLNKAYVLRQVHSELVVVQIIYANQFGRIMAFNMVKANSEETQCVMMNMLDEIDTRLDVFCFEPDNALHFVQSIAMKFPAIMTATRVYNNKTILAIGNLDDKFKSEGVIDIWTHEKGDGPLVKESCIPVLNLVDMDAFWTINYHTFLAVASGPIRGTRNHGVVYIYRYSFYNKQFEKKQTLEIENPLKVRFQLLLVSQEVLLYVLTGRVNDNLLVYKYFGVEGWIKVHQFTADEGTDLQVLDFSLRSSYYAHLAVASKTETNVFAVRFKGKNYYDSLEVTRTLIEGKRK